MSGTEIAMLKIGAELFTKTSPKGVVWVKEWWWRKEVLVVGQSRAGKSTFVDYIQHGYFGDEQETAETLDKTKSKQFALSFGNNSTLRLSAVATDMPGHIGAREQAKYAFDSRPHAILLFTDVTTLNADGTGGTACEWMRSFYARLNDLWRTKDKKHNRTQCFIVVANKIDKITDAQNTAYKKTLLDVSSTLSEGKGRMLEPLSVKPCVMVTNEKQDKLAVGVVRHLVKTLSGKS